jgi:hypothetical protein
VKRHLWLNIGIFAILLALLVSGCAGEQAALGGRNDQTALNSSNPSLGANLPGKESKDPAPASQPAGQPQSIPEAPGSNPPPGAIAVAPADAEQAAATPGALGGNPPPAGSDPANAANLLATPGNDPALAGGKPGGKGQPALPVSTQLILGMLKLEGTGQAVSATQAATLIPLWQSALDLSQAETPDKDAQQVAFEAIQAAMTIAQVEAIQAMQWTPEDMSVLTETLGIELPARLQGAPSPEQQATLQAGAPNGPPPGANGTQGPGMPAGGAGGQPPSGGPGGQPPARGQPLSGNGSSPGGPPGQGKLDAILYQAVIDWLSKKAQ